MARVIGSGEQSARTPAPLRQEISELLREEIALGEFAPGDRLIERELCERYQVSRTIVRETLRLLEAEGLVAMVANRGPEVARATREDIVGLYEVRGALEGLAAKLFAERAGIEDRRELEQAVDRAEEAMELGDRRAVLAAKDAFYSILLRGSENETLSSVLRTLYVRTQMLRGISLSSAGRGPHTIRELRRVLAAIAASDSEEAGRACEEHVRAAAAVALQQLDRVDGDIRKLFTDT